ncbi:MAG: hypothetical protein KAR79_03850 [Simkaniaceae bacterium]|nr:hypothetical protein [Simkaniaceae bacterium]
MKKIIFSCTVSLLTTLSANFTPAPMNDSFINSSKQVEPKMMIHNRPLAKINGKVISLMDVVKKMNVFINDNHPDVRDSEISLYQFYSTNWQSIFGEIVNNELMLLDAVDKDMPISEGDIHEEMEVRFGPNVMETLDYMSISHEEAFEMIKSEILVRQMLYLKVHVKAKNSITPKQIKNSYQDYLTSTALTEQWQYQVLSVRGEDQDKCLAMITKISNLIQENHLTFENLQEKISNENDFVPEGVRLSISEEFDVNEKNLSNEHQIVLSNLMPEQFSKVEKQQSRHGKNSVFRIFHLKSHTTNHPESFDLIAQELEDKIYNDTFQTAQAEYVDKLIKKYDVEKDPYFESAPNDYQPFTIY